MKKFLIPCLLHHEKTTLILIFSIVFAWLHSSAQPPKLVVQSFEYIRDSDPVSGKYWLNIPEADWIKDSIRKSFSGAIYQRWNMAMPEAALSLKPLSLFSITPKFNTRLKDKQPNTWYMFLQVFSKNNPTSYFFDTGDNVTVTLRLKCRIINGDNDSLILDRDLTVDIYTTPAPPDQVTLTKLPVHPAHFIHAFDSIATWLFSSETESLKSIKLKRAYVFSEPDFNGQPLAQLEFASNDASIHLLSQPSFSFKTPGPSYRKLTNKKNIGGNTASGVLTLFTGIEFNKDKTNNYSADFAFLTGPDSLHCIINYAQREVAERKRTKEKLANGHSYGLESGTYNLAWRGTDSTFINTVTLRADTIASFTITYGASDEGSNYTRLWDGTDSSTIMPLAKEWNNNRGNPKVFIKGFLYGNAFTMQSSKERVIKNFFVNDRYVLSVFGEKLPARALQFQQLSPDQLKLFIILSSLPYSSFNYAAY